MVTTTDIFRDLRRDAFVHCIPLSVTFEITQRCNIRCLHCYNFDRSRPYDHAQKENELSRDEVLRIIDEVREAGCLYLTFTGGEAVLHPNLAEFVRHARARHLAVNLKSNGTLLDGENVRMVVDAGVGGLTVSLFGATAPTHDAFTRSKESFDRAVVGIRTAKAAGANVRLHFNLVKTNVGEIGAMIALATSLDVAFTVDPFITARYDGTRDSLDLLVDRETLANLYRGPLRHLLPEQECRPTDSVASVQCSCARATCGISAYGDVYPCIAAPVPSGNLREKSFREIWTTSPELNRIRNLTLDDFAACKPCPHRSHCRRSSGVIYTNTGNYTGPDKFGDDWTCLEAEVVGDILAEASLGEHRP